MIRVLQKERGITSDEKAEGGEIRDRVNLAVSSSRNSFAHWCQILRCSFAHWCLILSCSFAHWCQILSCSFAHWCQILSCSFAHWCQSLSCSFASFVHEYWQEFLLHPCKLDLFSQPCLRVHNIGFRTAYRSTTPGTWTYDYDHHPIALKGHDSTIVWPGHSPSTEWVFNRSTAMSSLKEKQNKHKGGEKLFASLGLLRENLTITECPIFCS